MLLRNVISQRVSGIYFLPALRTSLLIPLKVSFTMPSYSCLVLMHTSTDCTLPLVVVNVLEHGGRYEFVQLWNLTVNKNDIKRADKILVTNIYTGTIFGFLNLCFELPWASDIWFLNEFLELQTLWQTGQDCWNPWKQGYIFFNFAQFLPPFFLVF